MTTEALSKLHERVSKHDVEFAELKVVVRSIAETSKETKEAVKAIHEAISSTNELIHTAQLKDEHFMAHINQAESKFEALGSRVGKLETGRVAFAVSLILAFAIGAGNMVSSYYFKEPDVVTVVAVDNENDSSP